MKKIIISFILFSHTFSAQYTDINIVKEVKVKNKGVVVSAHPLASEAGTKVLKMGMFMRLQTVVAMILWLLNDFQIIPIYLDPSTSLRMTALMLTVLIINLSTGNLVLLLELIKTNN